MRLRVGFLVTLLYTAAISGVVVHVLQTYFAPTGAERSSEPEWLTLSILLAGAAAMFFLWRRMMRQIIQPLEKLTEHVRQVSETQDLSLRARLDRSDEIGVLAREFDRLVERLESLHGGMSQKLEKSAGNLSELVIHLRRNQEFLKQLFDNSPIAIAQLDAYNRIVSINQAFETIFQYSAAEIIGQDIDALLVPPILKNEGQNISLRTFQGETISLETIRRRKDGQMADVYICGIPIYLDSERIGIYGMYIDITELKQAQREKIQLTEQLVDARKMEAVGTLAGGMAHEFNNLMAIVLGNTDLLLSGGLEDPGIVKRLQSIQDAAGRASTLTNQLLSFSRKQLLKIEPLEIDRLMDNLSYIMRNLYGERLRREIIVDTHAQKINADQGAITQALIDIIQNAWEAMDENGLIAIRVENVLLNESIRKKNADGRPGSFVRISISDNGCGMDESVIAHIFEPFFTTKRQKNAVGLGLAFVYGTIKQHEGWIEVSSKEGEGTTFTIYLPTVTSS